MGKIAAAMRSVVGGWRKFRPYVSMGRGRKFQYVNLIYANLTVKRKCEGLLAMAKWVRVQKDIWHRKGSLFDMAQVHGWHSPWWSCLAVPSVQPQAARHGGDQNACRRETYAIHPHSSSFVAFPAKLQIQQAIVSNESVSWFGRRMVRTVREVGCDYASRTLDENRY